MISRKTALRRRDILKIVGGALSAPYTNLALRALATGLPASVLLNPRPGRAAPDVAAAGPGRMLIMACSAAGDPVNANVPGTYGPGAEEVVHPQTASMAPTELRLSGQAHIAAKPWADLPQSLLDQTVFFHHATYTSVHPDHGEVMKMMGRTQGDEMLLSIYAKLLAPRQGSIQSVPMNIGAPGLSAKGRNLPRVSASIIAPALAGPRGALQRVQEIREKSLDEIFSIYKTHGTKHDLQLLDAWARTRDEAKGISQVLLARLESIEGSGLDDQVKAAAVLAALNLSPVISIGLDFGGDNHEDLDFENEVAQTVPAVARLAALMADLESLRREGVLRHEVIVSNLNVFGRELLKKGTRGRDHNRHHHVSVMMGPGFKGGVIGGVERRGRDFGCTSIDAQTGAAGGNITFENTFGSMAKTLGAALGIATSDLDEHVIGGEVVPVAFA